MVLMTQQALSLHVTIYRGSESESNVEHGSNTDVDDDHSSDSDGATSRRSKRARSNAGRRWINQTAGPATPAAGSRVGQGKPRVVHRP